MNGIINTVDSKEARMDKLDEDLNGLQLWFTFVVCNA